MPFTLTMPKLSPTMENGVIVKWHKKVGDFVEAGDLILDIATDKATVEYQALDEGWLRQILAHEQDLISINAPIAILTKEQSESLEGYQLPKPKQERAQLEPPTKESTSSEILTSDSSSTSSKQLQTPVFIPEPPLESYQFEFPTEELEKRILASPLAKKLAKEQNLDLTTVQGTGPNHRIMKKDLEKAQPIGITSTAKRNIPLTAPGTYEELPLSPMRKVIGQRLQESKTFIPHFYITQVIDSESLTKIREELISHQMKFSINDFILRATALALQENPAINVSFHSVNQTLVQFKTVDISVAVSIEGGLITPIIRHANYKKLSELSLEMRSLARRAREGKLDPKEYKGGSFTISNLGMFGVTQFQAIINPPQSAILAVGAIQEVPIVRQGQVVAGKTLTLTLSVDHRVIDGVVAAQFMQHLKNLLENPSILLIG